MKMSTSKRMLVGIVCLVIFETAVITSYILAYINSDIVQRMENSMQEILISNSHVLDAVLSDVVDASEQICVDLNMHNLIRVLSDEDVAPKRNWQQSMRKIVFGFFGSLVYGAQNYIMDINIFSESFSYTDRNLFSYDYEEFIKSDIYDSSLYVRPYYRWVSTSDAQDQLSDRMRTYMQGTDANVDTVAFRLVKRMNISTVVEGGTIYKLPNEIPSPYIVVSLNPMLLHDCFSMDGLTENARYMVVDEQGYIVSNVDSELNGQKLEYLTSLELSDSKQEFRCDDYWLDGEKYMIGISPMQSCNWYYICLIPWSDIVDTMQSTIRLYTVLMVILLCITLFIAVFFIRRTMRPVVELAQKAEDIASVKSGVLSNYGSRDTDRIMSVIDSMNEQIEQLTESNLELKLREKDTNILMLEMQINPHFLYNTLNRLHLGLLKVGQSEIAGKMLALSNALRYSVDTREHLVYLHRDITQLKLYLEVVQSAHENKYTVYFDIDDKLYDSIVPKMLLQPFVENAVLHGFKDMSFGCLIQIIGILEPNGDVLYTVADNGIGIPEEKKETVLSGINGHIGCANVHKRIQLLFGEKYGVTVVPVQVGTKIAIRLPCIFEK